jgi:hypothetical protein
MPDIEPDASARASREARHRTRQYVITFVLVAASIVIAGVAVSRGGEVPSPSSTSHQTNRDAPTTAPTVSTRDEVAVRLRRILQIRDRALLERDAGLLSGIYTVDCKCLKDGRALIQQLERENIVWRGVKTSVDIKSAEEVNDRLWIIVATVSTPSVRIETEAGQLVRIVPPERNLVRFALARPQNQDEWLLGNAATFE